MSVMWCGFCPSVYVGGQATRDRLGGDPGNHRGTSGPRVLPTVAPRQREPGTQTRHGMYWTIQTCHGMYWTILMLLVVGFSCKFYTVAKICCICFVTKTDLCLQIQHFTILSS